MKDILIRLVAHEELTRKETEEILINITHEKYPQEQITAFLMGLQMRGIGVDELLGLRDGIRCYDMTTDEFYYACYLPKYRKF